MFKKGGEPLLIVPRGIPQMATALELYPAQTAKARLARGAWRLAVRRGLSGGAERDVLVLHHSDPFVEFLVKLSSHTAATGPANVVPQFAVLAGNPHAQGRRFLVLVFSPSGQPVAVVKAGKQPAAIELIEKEAAFLAGAPSGLPGVPALQALFHNSAFALNYIAGHSPRPRETGEIERILKSWLERGQQRPVDELAAWRRLAGATPADGLFGLLAKRLGGFPVQACVFHGDLAPWNIKISRANGAWMVLDWERGDLAGPPAWDWFHYVLQPAILVRRQSAIALAQTAEALLESPAFQAYARAAGLGSISESLCP